MPQSESNSPRRSNSREKRKESVANEQDDKTCLYIGNIDKKVTGEELTQIFKKYGELEYCYIINEPSSSERGPKEVKISRGYGFAKFKSMEDTIRAKNELDGLDINERRIRVQISKRNRARESTPGRYLGRKRASPPRRRRRSYSNSSSDSYHRRKRHHDKKRKHRRSKSRDSRDRSYRRRSPDSRDRDREYRRRRSYSNQRQKRHNRP